MKWLYQCLWQSAFSALLLATGSCLDRAGPDESSNFGEYRGPINDCAQDSDCPPASVCEAVFKHCVKSGGPSERSYFVRVVPRPETGIPEQTFEVTMSDMSPVTPPQRIEVRKFQVVSLNISAQSATGAAVKTDFQVDITDMGTHLPGTPRHRATYMVPEEIAGNFQVNLLSGPNRTYTIKIAPRGDTARSFAPVTYTGVTVTAAGELRDSNGNALNALVVPQAEQAVSGRIRRGNQPVDDLEVVALDPQTGVRISTRAITGCPEGSAENEVCGEFEIWLAPNAEEVSLLVSNPDSTWYPNAVIPNISIEKESDAGSVRLDVPALDPLPSPVHYAADVKATIEWQDGIEERYGLENCLVIFESNDVAGGISLRTARTNASGEIENEIGANGIFLFPAVYRISVIPPHPEETSPVDYDILTWHDYQILSASSGQSFILKERPILRGIVTAEGLETEVPAGLVTAEPLTSAPPHARSSRTRVQEDGGFTLGIDKGDYRLTVESPAKSGFAWRSLFVTDVDETVREITLPIPFIARLALDLVPFAGEAGTELLRGAMCEWYEVINGRAFAVGRAFADGDGQVVTLLEPRD
ncbi:MAG: hypothetical protein QNJ97_09735 [Myxococcota bacterium]|nr:hypothetical protein [Myxococcota bacterium]